jgi:hypothetical protein
MTQPEFSWSTNDVTNRERVLSLLGDGQWHSTAELVRVGGSRAPARVHELRREGYVIACDGERGRYRYRLTGRAAPPPRALSWKERALRAEAKLSELGVSMFPGGGST